MSIYLSFLIYNYVFINYRFVYLLSSLDSLFGTGADWIVLWVTHAYAHEHIIQPYAYAPRTKKLIEGAK